MHALKVNLGKVLLDMDRWKFDTSWQQASSRHFRGPGCTINGIRRGCSPDFRAFVSISLRKINGAMNAHQKLPI